VPLASWPSTVSTVGEAVGASLTGVIATLRVAKSLVPPSPSLSVTPMLRLAGGFCATLA